MALYTPFRITAREVEQLDADMQVALLNDLMRNRASRIGLQVDDVRTTLRTSDPDGGVDAICDVGEREDEYLGRGLSVWQFKKSWPTAYSKKGEKTELEKELEKPGVQEVCREGGGYVMVLGKDVAISGRNGQTARLARLRELAQQAEVRGEVRLLAADAIASWASVDPAVLLSFRPIQGFTRADFELRQARHGIPFQPDDTRSEIDNAIFDTLIGPHPITSHVRINGRAGVGKTRLALEAVRSRKLDADTFYSPNVPASKDFFTWMVSNVAVEANLIVDECDEADAQWLDEWADRCAGRLRLITVGPGMSHGQDVFPLDVLTQEAMERVVRSAAILPDEQVRWIADKTRGFVKLAVVVAQAVAAGTTSVAQLRGDFRISGLVERMLVPREEGKRALRGVALLTRVGYAGNVEVEGKTIAAFMGLDWDVMRQELVPAQDQGIVVSRGRYWYVSPEILATWLAGEVWRHQADRIVELVERLPNVASRMTLHERLAGLSDIPEVEIVVKELLGPQGSFRDLTATDGAQSSRLFATLARSHPQAALSALTRLIRNSSHQALLDFKTGRREIIWVLERLLERRKTFFDAARLLRHLAEAENETYANNATGVWAGAFLTMLASTEVPAIDRLVLIDEAMAASSSTTRKLAVDGLSSALSGHEWAIPPGNDSDLPPVYWRPKTHIEFLEFKRAALQRLSLLLSDEDMNVSREAWEALQTHARSLVNYGVAEEFIALLEHVGPEEEATRRKTWESVMGVLRFEKSRLTEGQLHRLGATAQRFFGDSLADRIKRYVGPGSFVNWPDEDEGELHPEQIARQLAEEAYQSEGAIESLLPWLFSLRAENVWDFAHRLGEIDHKLRWLDRLEATAIGSANPRMLSGYLRGYSEGNGHRGQQRIDSVLDRWSANESHAQIVADATLQGKPNTNAVERLITLIEKGWLEARLLGWLRYGGWMYALPTPSVIRVIECLLHNPSAETITAGLGLLTRWLQTHNGTMSGDLEQAAWRLLESPTGWVHHQETMYFWKHVGESLVATDPRRIVDLVLRIYQDGDPSFRDERLKLLAAAATQSPKAVWDATGEALLRLRAHLRLRLAWELKEIGFILNMPHKIVEQWITMHGSETAKIIGESIEIPGVGSLPELVRFLISNYSDAVGGILVGSFLSGGWVGSETSYLKGKLETSRKWQYDEDLRIRGWAIQLCDYLEEQIRDAQLQEEEEEIIR